VKKTNYIRKLTTYFVLCCLSLSSLLFYFPGNTVLSAAGGPSLEILAPEEGGELDTALVAFTGRISDDLTPPEKITFKVYEILAGNEEPLNITDTGDFTSEKNGDYGEWTYSREFTNGSHTLQFRVEDEDANSTDVQFSFTVNQPTTGPSDESDTATPDEPSTEVSGTETEDEEEGSTEEEALSEEEDTESVPRPSVVSLNILPNGVGPLPAEDMTNVPVNAAIEMIVRESGDLIYSTEPLIVTSSGGKTINSTEATSGIGPEGNGGDDRITFTPTEALEYSTTYYVFVNPAITNDQGGRIHQRFVKFTTAPLIPSNEIHGNFGNNTNSCANCHSTHNGNDEKLLGGKYGAETARNLCMSCHDGTNGAPIPDHYNTQNQHFNYTEDLEATYSCTSCHNPHTSWTADNPNKLKGHPETTYRKQGTAAGISTDFSLCLQCHDGEKAVDIKKYYEEEALFAESGHNIIAEDGTALNGQLTCADCHETHGSDNLMLLKGNLGNAPLTEADKFKAIGTDWTIENERNFCLKCHNGSTELYGKNPIYKGDIDYHLDTEETCSYCHGTGDDITEQMRSAAHGPKKLIAEEKEKLEEPADKDKLESEEPTATDELEPEGYNQQLSDQQLDEASSSEGAEKETQESSPTKVPEEVAKLEESFDD
jgi:predicted CXXCH cytochrome family protein